MDSPSTTDDSFRRYNDSDQIEDYDESEWHDQDCTAPFTDNDQRLTSKICFACQRLFSGFKETQKLYKHYFHISALRTAADNGCQLCALLRSKVDRETKNHLPSEILRSETIIYQRDLKDNITTFELWFQYLRIPKTKKYTDVVWGIEIIDFLLSERKLISPPVRRQRCIGYTAMSDVFDIQ